MENSNEMKVGWFEDKLDTAKLVGEVVVAGVGIIAGILGVIKGTRAIKFKRTNPNGYWEEKRLSDYKASKMVADSVNHLADSILDLGRSIK